ncbi:uncharacterized protein [Aristolochia californica]|uniref:uncharacterized protein n=1 Tax=Aristolochia californica TaxID=171875 RepID=UPI0035DE1572
MASNFTLKEAVDLNTQTLAESSTIDDDVPTEKNDSMASPSLEPAECVDGGEDQHMVLNGGIEVKEECLDEKGIDCVSERDDEAKAETCKLKKDLEAVIRTDNSELCEIASNVNSHILGDLGSNNPILVDSSSKSEAVSSSASGSLPVGHESRVIEAQDSQTSHVENMGASIENLDRSGALQAGLVYPVSSDENAEEKIPGTNQENNSKDVMVDSYSLVEVPVEHYSLPNEDAGPAHLVVSSLDPAIIGVQESSQEEDENMGACSYNSDEYAEFNSEDRDPAMTGIEYYNHMSGGLVVDLGASFAARENYGTVTEYVGAIEDENMESEYSETEEMQTLENDIMFTDENHARYPLPQLRESNFSVSDLVWGKVRSHPWWPAQIFDPSDASEIAIKHKKRDNYLVAYFGDHTFAWNEASRLRPFCTHFTQMEKQSTLAAFLNAVDCALEEISRRVEFGLACYCIPDEVYNRIKAQVMDNTGIREGASVADSAYGSLNMTALEPDKLVQYIKDLAVLPSGGADRLELTVAKAQLLSFYRSKGYPKLPEFKIHRMLLENEEKNLPPERKSGNDVTVDHMTLSYKKSKNRDGSSRKRKSQILEDGIGSSKKQRSLADLLEEKISTSLENGGKHFKTTQPVSTKSGRGRKRKISSMIDIGQIESPTAKKSFNVGECIRRVASQLTGSSPILKSNQEKYQKGGVKLDRGRDKSISTRNFPETSEKMQRKNIGGKMEYPSPNEMLSQLWLAARDPMKGYSFLSTILGYFSEYRDMLLQDNNRLRKQKKKPGVGKLGGLKSESMETFKFDDVKDSYWTDRIVLNNAGELLKQSESVLVKEGDENTSLNTNHELKDEKLEEECSPTALILNFTEAGSLPTESDLKNIFNRYGPLKESETEVMRKSKRAKVVFKRQADAEVAFSSAGKFSIFGPALASYRLRYLTSPTKSNHASTTSSRKDATTLKDCIQTSELAKTQTAECRDEPPLLEGSNPTSQLSENDKIEMEQESQLSSEENSSLMLKQTEKHPAEIACRADVTSVEEHSTKCEFRGDSDLQEAGDFQTPSKEESEKKRLLSDDVNQVEHIGELPSTDGCNQISQLPENDATWQEGVVELCSIEGRGPMCTPPQNVEGQIECRAEVSTSKISQSPMEDVNVIEYGEPCSMEGNDELTELPNNVELQTENVTVHICGEEIDKALDLHEKVGNQIESGCQHHHLEGTIEIYQCSGMDLNQIEFGGKFCTEEGDTQLIDQTKNVQLQKIGVSELHCTEGTHLVSELHKKDGPQIASGPEVCSREGKSEVSHSLKKDINQIECQGEICSQEGCNQLTDLPTCRDSDKQVSELHDEEVNHTEFISESHTLEIGYSMSAVPEDVEMHGECAGELPPEKGIDQVLHLPGAEQASVEDSNQMSEIPQKFHMQTESLSQSDSDSVKACSLMSELPKKGDVQAESVTKFVSEGGCQTSEPCRKGELQRKSVSELPSMGGGHQVTVAAVNDVQRMESGSSVSSVQIHLEGRDQMPLLLGKDETSTDCGYQVPERQGSDTV